MVTVMNLGLEQLKNYNLLARSTLQLCLRSDVLYFVYCTRKSNRMQQRNSRRPHAGYTANTSGQR